MSSILENTPKTEKGKQKSPILCCVKFCRRRHAPRSRRCYTCLSRRHKELNPIAYRFNIAKQSAKSRGIAWELTIDQYTDFCVRTGYLEGSGKTRQSLTIDRIDPTHGYREDNIRCIPHWMNDRLGAIYGAYMRLNGK